VTQPDVKLDSVVKRFDDVVVDGITLEIPSGSLFALLGPSGCGKTTTLRMIGGFEEPDEGAIYLGDRDVVGLPSYRRDVNTVFQSYALFPHLSIFENVAFGLRRKRVEKAYVKGRVTEMFRLVGLEGLGSRRGRAPVNFLIFLPMAAPEIVLGASLLTLFLNQSVLDLGFWTIFIAHVMFCISFVVVTVRARLVDFDRHLEEAAADLGATGFDTFRLITMPLLWPAILAGGLLAFAISIDDFVITYFNSGSEITFPVFVWGRAARGVPPQVNVIGSAVFLLAVGIMLVSVIVQTRRRKESPA